MSVPRIRTTFRVTDFSPNGGTAGQRRSIEAARPQKWQPRRVRGHRLSDIHTGVRTATYVPAGKPRLVRIGSLTMRIKARSEMTGMNQFELWRRTLAFQSDSLDSQREILRQAYLGFRERTAQLVGEIGRLLPELTVHLVLPGHCD